MVNTRLNGSSLYLASTLQLRNLHQEVTLEAKVEEELGVGVEKEWCLLEMRYESKMLPKMRPLTYILKK